MTGMCGIQPAVSITLCRQAQVVEAGKRAIKRRTGLPARDLRILDPLLSYPSTVLGRERERAIVINLEHIKAIIRAQEVLLLNSKDSFIDNLMSFSAGSPKPLKPRRVRRAMMKKETKKNVIVKD
ncbi:hypothetical protein M0R45_029239 [Rubus argutus]|uniref:Ribosomal protein S13 n=1 Tax=Rubus argutus TaxID=59490 RepID=A0AAW1W9X8_RUBAR